MKTALRYLIAFPAIAVGVLYVYGAVLVGLAEKTDIEDDLLFTAEWKIWWAKKWRYSTAAGRGIIMHPLHLANVFEHEKVHVRQSEDLCAHGLILGALLAWFWGQWWLGLLVWFLSPAAHLLNYGMAWLRGEDPYMGAEHEKSAYAQQDDHDRGH